MMLIPQADLISINTLPVPLMVPAAAKTPEGGPAPRFDVALLEAAKTVKDGMPEGTLLNLSPKVQQALEAVLADLAQKPLAQLNTLAKQPDGLKPLVIQAAKDAGLNAEEQQALQDLAPMALPRLVEFRKDLEVQGTMPADSNRVNGNKPGPQGGTPVTTASPADFLTPERAGQPAPLAPPSREQAATDPGNASLSAMAASLLTPVIVSTRTDDGSGNQSALASQRPAQAPVAPVAAPASVGRVIEVAVQAPVLGAPVAPAQTASAPAPEAGKAPAAPVNTANSAPEAQGAPIPQAAPAAPRTSAPVTPQQAFSTNVAPASQAQPGTPQASVKAVGQDAPSAPQSQAAPAKAEAPAANQAPSAPTAPADMDVQFVGSKAPVAVQADSVVTLTADNRWVLPEIAQSAPQGVPAAGAQVQTPTAPQPIAQAAVPVEAQPQAQAPQQPASAQAPVAAPAPASPAAAASAPVVAQAAAAVQSAPAAPAKEAPVAPEAKAQTAAANVNGEAQGAEQATAVQARRQSDESSFSSLAQFGQDPMKSIAQQTAKDYAVKRAVFDQVAEALREAPQTDSGKLLIRLKPANLGEVQVDLVMQGGKLSARLVASQADVREAFLRDLPAFKAGLEAQGVSVKEVSVALRAGVQDQPQGQTPQQDQSWWRELPREEKAAPVVVPVTPAYSGPASTENDRFSALA